MSRQGWPSVSARLVAVLCTCICLGAVVWYISASHERGGVLDAWAFGPIQKPSGRGPVDPATLRRLTSDVGLQLESPEGWLIQLGKGLDAAPTLPPTVTLLYRDNHCLVVLDGDSRRPRTLYAPRLKNTLIYVPLWVPDPPSFFDVLDCQHQLISIDPATGNVLDLAHNPLKRTYKNQAYTDPSIAGAPVYDKKRDRLLYLKTDYATSPKAWLVQLTLADGKETELSRRFVVEGSIYHTAFDLNREVFYTLARDGRISNWDFAGQAREINATALKGWAGWFDLSSDGRYLAVRRSTDGIIFDVSFSARMAQLPDGNLYTWSPDGKQIAYLRGEDELWVYDVSTARSQFFARFEPSHRTTHPDLVYSNESPLWSPDGKHLAVRLNTWIGAPTPIHTNTTLVLDFAERRVVILPVRAYGMAWCTQSKPFPSGLHFGRTSSELRGDKAP